MASFDLGMPHRAKVLCLQCPVKMCENALVAKKIRMTESEMGTVCQRGENLHSQNKIFIAHLHFVLFQLNHRGDL